MAEPMAEDEIKKRATRRLIVAVSLVALAAGILTWLSHYKPTPPVTRPAAETVPPPPIIAPAPEPAPEATPVTPAPGEPVAESGQPPEPPPAPPATATPSPSAGLPPTLGAPPPPRVASKPLPPPGPKTPPAEVVKPLVKAEPAAPAAPAAVPAPAAAPHGPSGYVVQFGVFANPQNALQLVERLRAAGIEAQTETRVILPPFKSRAEAEAALARLRAKGIDAVVVAR